jgi:hypothetical protein
MRQARTSIKIEIPKATLAVMLGDSAMVASNVQKSDDHNGKMRE